MEFKEKREKRGRRIIKKKYCWSLIDACLMT
jgi:hypothetical protein